MSKLAFSPQFTISRSGNIFFKSTAFSLVLLLKVILATSKLFNAIRIDGTTPPAPKINIFLSLTS